MKQSCIDSPFVLVARAALALGLALSSSVLRADTATADPTGDDAESGAWSGASAGTRYTLVDDYPDASGADFLAHGTSAGNLTFTFSPFTLPEGAAVSVVGIQFYARKSGGGGDNIGLRFKIAGNYYNGSTASPTTTWTDYQLVAMTNPRTGAAWTVADVNGTGSNPLEAFGWFSSDANPTVQLSSIQCSVSYTYTPPGARKRRYTLVVRSRPSEAPAAKPGRIRREPEPPTRRGTNPAT